MVALFDHEEVGSDSAQGAGSPAMFDSLTRITQSFATDGSKVKNLDRTYVLYLLGSYSLSYAQCTSCIIANLGKHMLALGIARLMSGYLIISLYDVMK